MSGVSEELARWASALPAPAEALAFDRARMAFKDGCLCILAGVPDAATQTVLDTAKLTHGVGNVPVLGTGVSLSPAGAALVNGTAAHALDFDDNFVPAFTHATAVLLPALISAGCTSGASGRDMLSAYIIGLELQARISRLVNPGHYLDGWHATSTIGAIGTAGACAALMKLDASGVARAMSIAFSLASGSKLQFGTQTKPTHAGFAAHNAVLAAMLARSGLSAQEDFLQGRWSLSDFWGQGKEVRGEDVLADLGTSWSILEHGLLMKRFPCCAAAHMALDGVERLRRDHGARLETVRSITAFLPPAAYRNLRFDRPQTASEARFSFTYTAARVLRHGHLSLDHFTDVAVSDRDILQHLDKFHRATADMPTDAALGKTEIIAEQQDGRDIRIELDDIVGSKSGLSAADLSRKAETCLNWSGLGLPETTLDVMEDLETVRNFENCISGLTTKQPSF